MQKKGLLKMRATSPSFTQITEQTDKIDMNPLATLTKLSMIKITRLTGNEKYSEVLLQFVDPLPLNIKGRLHITFGHPMPGSWGPFVCF